jgi:hypothetical protein
MRNVNQYLLMYRATFDTTDCLLYEVAEIHDVRILRMKFVEVALLIVVWENSVRQSEFGT